MTELSLDALVRIAREYYPEGFPPGEDDYTQKRLAFQQTPEYLRWEQAWDRAEQWEAWDSLLEALRGTFPGQDVWDVTQPRMSACLRCCVYFRQPLAGGARLVTRLVGAASILAPLYLVYATTQVIGPGSRAERPQLFLEPAEELKRPAERLAQHLERHLDFQPFPLQWASAPLPELRVVFLHEDKPTLLDALLSSALSSLP